MIADRKAAIPRRVALVMANLELGGAERQAVELARLLPSFGWQPILLVAENHGPLADVVRREEIPLFDLGAEFWHPKWSPRFWLNLLATMWRIRSICRAEGVSVVQSFLYWQNVIAAPVARLTPGVRAVITGRRNMGYFKDRRSHYQFIENIINRMTDRIICNSWTVVRDARRRERFVDERILMIPNGVSEEFQPEGPRADPGAAFPELADAEFLVGTVGNLKRQKRHDVFLRAIAQVRKTHPGVKGVVIGRDLGEGDKLRRLRDRLGLAGAVVFAGSIDDVAPWYRALDLFVLCSDYEGSPNVVIEAMASGVPVVTTSFEGSREVTANGVAGLMAQRGNPDDVAKAIVRLHDDRHGRQRLRHFGIERARTRHSNLTMAETYARLYEQLL